MHTFSILVSIRDIDDEYDYMKKSFPSALELNPTEIIVGLDKPALPFTKPLLLFI